MSLSAAIKSVFLPDRLVPCRITCGPFRGARLLLNPRTSLRYILGIYEHELNAWLRRAIPRANVVFDVGANHGYFCFGVMAAWHRQGKSGAVFAFEPQAEEFNCLERARPWNQANAANFVAVNRCVGRVDSGETVSLQHYYDGLANDRRADAMLVKIDVEGAELEVLAGAEALVKNGNLFLIEAHSHVLLEQVKQFLSDRQHAFEVICQRPLPLLGREQRDTENYWVVSKL